MRAVFPTPPLALFVALALGAGEGAEPPAPRTKPRVSPDVVRATVQIRHGEARGSGTVVASVTGSTYVLTAAHVVKGAARAQVELHRHNLGPSAPMLTEGGGWPRLAEAAVVAADPASDVALLKIEGLEPLKHVARIVGDAGEPTKGDVLTSVGIDRGRFLTRWKTTVLGAAAVDIKQGGDGARRFTLTTRHPEHGRSGGGLFRADGAIVGICTGMTRLETGRPKVGLFASSVNVLSLLRSAGLLGPARSP